MLAKITRVLGIGVLSTVLSVHLLVAQPRVGTKQKKTIRTATSVNTQVLQPVLIVGQESGQPSAARTALSPSFLPGWQPSRKQGWQPSAFLRTLPKDTIRVANLEIKRSVETGLPIFFREKGNGAKREGFSLGSPNARLDVNQASLTYLNRLKDVLQVEKPSAEFRVKESKSDAFRQSHVRLGQVYKGVDVYGSELILHLKNNAVQTVSSRHFPTPQLADVTASVTEAQAIQTVIANVGTRTKYRALNAKQQSLLDYQRPTAKLIIYHLNGNPSAERLVWHVTLRPNLMELWDYFVDAKTGQVVHQYNHTCSADGPRTASCRDLQGATQQINTYQVGSAYYFIDGSRAMFNAGKSKLPDSPVGALWTIDARRTYGKNFAAYQIMSNNNVWTDAVAISAHCNGSKAFEYFKNVHGRNSLDGNGGTIITITNVMDENGQELDNAFWNGKFMAYGNGNKYFKPFAGALDVAGHEMSHGVIENSANLEYQGQPGAINESMADIFGVLIDNDDWTVGEDVVKKEYFTSGALRNLADPHNGGSNLKDLGYQPRVMAEFYTGTEDNGGVHVNSGIPNWAFYKFATEVSKQKAEKVYYRALTTYLTARSQFIDLRLAVIQAATDIHGANSNEVAAARRAFDAVGILETGTDDEETPSDLPVNPGQDYILCHDASLDDSDPNTWYVAASNGSSLDQRSQTPGKSRPSVTDKGDVAYFVGVDNRIRALALSGAPKENIIQNEPFWSNVAISKDGKRLAAVSTAADTSIYVYDFATQKWAKFRLYNPTYSKNVTTGNVRYADAIEWDYTGQFLVYDAYNVINTPEGDVLDYWDVGLIKVWDNPKNAFGKGTVEKIFSSLPENVSIGNPSFSKTSSSIMAFDLFNTEEESYTVVGVDLGKGTVAAIAENTTFGFPTFSKSDDQLAYTSYSDNGDTIINVIPLKGDKINPNGTPTTILREAKWAVWHVRGERKLLNDAKEITAFQFGGLAFPAKGVINGTAIKVTVPPTTDVTNLIAYFAHSSSAEIRVGNQVQVSGATKNNFTNPVTYTVVAQDGSTKSYTITVLKAVSTATSDSQDISHEIALYPNPNDGQFQLQLNIPSKKPIQIEIYTAMGALVQQKRLASYPVNGLISLQLPDVPAGLYHLRLRTGDQVAQKKIMIN